MLDATPRPATARQGRRAALVLAVALAASLVGVWEPQSADATSYRFWSYWTGGSGWTFASQGAARRPADGAVEGWRFAISPATSSTIPPRHSPSFESLCGKTAPQDGKKRVGLVIDSGVAADAPDGESPPSPIATCVVVPTDATGYDVLMSAASLRTEQGLVCGIDGYPATECGTAVADPAPSQSDGGSGSAGTGGDGTGGTGGGSGSTTDGDSGRSGNGEAGDGSPIEGDKADPSEKNGPADTGSGPEQPGDATAAPGTTDDTVAAAAATTPATQSKGSPLGLVVGGLLVAGLAVAGYFAARRRRA